MTISVADANTKLEFWKERVRGYETKSRQNGGKLTRSEMWYYEYCQSPYLTLAGDEYLSRRFIDQFHNNIRLTRKGQIAPRVEFTHDSGLFGPLFAHLWVEYQCRGGTPTAVIAEANDQVRKYFVNDTPTGALLFRNHPETIENVLVKFGKQTHLERMLSRGEVRISPADYYSSGSLLKAMTDFETQREFHIPSFREFLAGRTHVKIRDLDAKIDDGFIKIVVECPKYMLWCACLDIDRRMPDDFGADSALIIKDPRDFLNKMAHKLRDIWPKAKVWCGPVKYYDPCSFVDMNKRPETIKHFSFAYQHEWRFCIFPGEAEIPAEPIIVELGSLANLAELVTLS